MLKIGLNPYGIAYSAGLFAAGTPRENPRPLGLNGFLDLADLIGASGVELPIALLKGVAESDTARLRERLHASGRYAILMHGISWGDPDSALLFARRFGFKTIRMHLTSVLCGARAALGGGAGKGSGWTKLYDAARAEFLAFARSAADAGLAVTLENHQDLSSAELLEICGAGGPNVGLCLDTGNPLAVGEDPLEFAQALAPHVKLVHLKDYRVFWDPEGYRLARCPIGAGAVAFKAIAQALEPFGEIPASIEPGALTERHVKLLTREWWQGYPEIDGEALGRRLSAAQQHAQPDGADWRTPWDKAAAPDEICKYEIEQLMQSVLNLQELGLWA